MLRESLQQKLPEAMLVSKVFLMVNTLLYYLLKVHAGRHCSAFQDVLVEEAHREKAKTTTVGQIGT